METNRFQIVLSALQQMVISNNNEQATAVTHTLSQQQEEPGYVVILVTIIRQKQYNQKIIFAALTQLKNTVRSKWRPHMLNNLAYSDPLSVEDRTCLIGSLIEMNIVHSDNYTSFKLLKDVCQIVSDDAIKLAPFIFNYLQAGNQLKPCLNVLLGVSNSYRYGLDTKMRLEFMKVLQYIMPAIYKLVQIGQQKLTDLYWAWHSNQTNEALVTYSREKEVFEEILYMSMKLACKTTYFQLPVQLRKLYCAWSIIAQNRLDQENETYSQHARESPLQCGRKGTDEFNYFHGKKWAAKFMEKFLRNVVVYKKRFPQITNISVEYFNQHGQLLKETLHRMFTRDQPNTIRYFQLSLLQRYITDKYRLMSQDFSFYLFEILPRYATVSAEQLQDLNENPMEFIISESISDNNFKNLKILAKGLWRHIVLSDSIAINGIHEGQWIVHCYQKIKEWLMNQSWQVKQVALFYMISTGSSLKTFTKSRLMAQQLLNLCLPHIFHQPILILQVRGFQLVTRMAIMIREQLFPEILDAILAVFYQQQRTKASSLVVLAIQAGIALQNVILYGSSVIKRFTQEEMRLILSTILELIKHYEQMPQLTDTLKTLITQYPTEMSKYSIDLVRYLALTVRQGIERLLAPQAVVSSAQPPLDLLNVLQIMIELKTNDETFDYQLTITIQNEIISLLGLILSCGDKLAEDYLIKVVELLSSYMNSQTHKLTALSKQVNFYFLVLLFKIVPFTKQHLNMLQQSNFTQAQQFILEQPHHIDDLDLTDIFRVFRNYLKFINPQAISLHMRYQSLSPCLFQTDLLNQFFYLVYFYYKQIAKPTQNHQYSIFRGRNLSTMLLICIIEHHQRYLPDTFYAQVIRVIVINQKSEKYKHLLHMQNMQLFCMWVWGFQNVTQFIRKTNHMRLSQIFKHIFMVNNIVAELTQINSKHCERRRIMLGFCRMIEFGEDDQELRKLYSYFFEWLFFYASEICKDPNEEQEDHVVSPCFEQVSNGDYDPLETDQNKTNNSYIFENNDQPDDKIDEDEEGYTELRSIDEIQYFLETLLRFKSRDGQLYKLMIDHHLYKLMHVLKYSGTEYNQKYMELIRTEI